MAEDYIEHITPEGDVVIPDELGAPGEPDARTLEENYRSLVEIHPEFESVAAKALRESRVVLGPSTPVKPNRAHGDTLRYAAGRQRVLGKQKRGQ